jgi:tRNA pseudouridine32 synthase/23S rRNA pseudouridine746 synthase
MLELGHPILGDPIYATGAARTHPRLMLHAETLALHHPASGEPRPDRALPPAPLPRRAGPVR